MNKSLKKLLTLLIIFVTAAAVVFLSVFLLAKQKKIFINKWFVDESSSTIGADVSAYQADVDMNKLKEQNIQFLYIKATEGSTLQDERFAENWKNAKKPVCSPAPITSSPMTARAEHRRRISSAPSARI